MTKGLRAGTSLAVASILAITTEFTEGTGHKGAPHSNELCGTGAQSYNTNKNTTQAHAHARTVGKLLAKLVVDGGQLLAVAAPRGVKLDQHVLALVHDNLLEGGADQDGDGALLRGLGVRPATESTHTHTGCDRKRLVPQQRTSLHRHNKLHVDTNTL